MTDPPPSTVPPARLSRARRFLRFLAWTFALAQATALFLAAGLAWFGGGASIIHLKTASYDVVAWDTPFPGRPGAIFAAAQAVSILAALWLTRSSASTWRRLGLVVLLCWGAFWTLRIGNVYRVSGEGEFLGMAIGCA